MTPSPDHSPVPVHLAGDPCGPLAPAPYGKACAGCARAKCKCFYRYEGSDCERCHRLGKKCEASTAIRKRKAQAQPAPHSHFTTPGFAPPPNSNNANNNNNNSRLEEKLDDLVTLLRSQAVDKAHTPPPGHQGSPQSYSSRQDSGSPAHGMASMPTPPAGASASVSSAGSPFSIPFRSQDPDLMISMDNNVVHYLRPAEPLAASSPIFNDVAVHNIPEAIADESLDVFRRAFITTFPFVHIPPTMSSAELLIQKPFLWLNIMAFTTRMVSRQFAMEETIWEIISRRIVSQQHASLDLLLGVICFASWSHYFKQNKPFMTMLSQVAVSLAFELGIQKDVNAYPIRRNQFGAPTQLRAEPPRPQLRTMEERRTILAVFHLTSSTWTAYRKTEPLRWTSYFDDCLSVLSEGRETDLDILLVTQVKCQIITNSLTCPHFDSFEDESSNVPPAMLMKAMLGRLTEIRQSLPALMRTERITELYLYSTETTIQESFLNRPGPKQDVTGASHFRRLQDLQSILNSVERWLTTFMDMPLIYWTGVSMDTFSQLTHSLVVLFRLTTHNEPGWDQDEVRRRADVLSILDQACDTIDQIPPTLGIVDADGPRSGLFFKTTYLFRAIKTLFMREMKPKASEGQMSFSVPVSTVDASMDAAGEPALVDDFIMNLSNEPWLADLLAMGPSWNAGPETFLYPPYAEY